MASIHVQQEWTTEPVQGTLDLAAAVFEEAVAKLEGSLAHTVSDIADIARRTGFQDGRDAALAEIGQMNVPAADADMLGELLALREALAASRDREARLMDALARTRGELDDSIQELEALLAS